MIIASAQMKMGWTIAENQATICELLTTSSQAGAQVLLLPECSLTGFHVRIKESLDAHRIDQGLDELAERCRQTQVHCLVGSPYYPTMSSSRPWNATIHITHQGRRATIFPKVVLHGDEKRIFTPGASKPSGELNVHAFSVFLCHEAWHESFSPTSFAPPPKILFWPSIVGNTPPSYAANLSRRFGAYVIQANWANHLGLPDRKGFGGSVAVGPDGEVLYQAPSDKPDLFYTEVPDVQPADAFPV